MALKAQQNGLFKGLVSHLITNGVAILQYANDTILCFENNSEEALHLISLCGHVWFKKNSLRVSFCGYW